MGGDETVQARNHAGPERCADLRDQPGRPQRPSANSVTVVRLDANHNPLPPGSTATPAFVRFDGITGHFSTFAIVTVHGGDLMIGGRGADRLVGNAGDDILIVGPTAFDANAPALRGIQAEWASARDYATRVANLRGFG